MTTYKGDFMKLFTLALTLAFFSAAYAGPGHSHSHKHAEGEEHSHDEGHGHSHAAPSVTIDEKTAQTTGMTEIQRLIKKGKLDATWSNATFDKSEKKQFGKKTEWVVTYNNDKGVDGKKLYIFLKTNGEFVAANFTGK
jgi:Family of unknown function (DUF6488)